MSAEQEPLDTGHGELGTVACSRAAANNGIFASIHAGRWHTSGSGRAAVDSKIAEEQILLHPEIEYIAIVGEAALRAMVGGRRGTVSVPPTADGKRMWPGNRLTYFWCPVSTGRHAYPIAARDEPHDVVATAYCGAETVAVELHPDTEADWIRGDTRMNCWHTLAKKLYAT